jgi:hypothetical protein
MDEGVGRAEPPCDPGGPRHRREAAITKRPHLASGEQAPATLVKARAQQIVMAADGDFVDHAPESIGSHPERESSTQSRTQLIHLFWLSP